MVVDGKKALFLYNESRSMYKVEKRWKSKSKGIVMTGHDHVWISTSPLG